MSVSYSTYDIKVMVCWVDPDSIHFTGTSAAEIVVALLFFAFVMKWNDNLSMCSFEMLM